MRLLVNFEYEFRIWYLRPPPPFLFLTFRLSFFLPYFLPFLPLFTGRSHLLLYTESAEEGRRTWAERITPERTQERGCGGGGGGGREGWEYEVENDGCK
jgi:hypothetical protein